MDLLSYLLGRNSVKPSPAPTPEPSLPTEYTAVTYIESSGTQYINTDYIPNSNTKIKTKCSAIVSGGGLIFGNRQPAESGEDDIYYALGTTSSKMTFFYNHRIRQSSSLNVGDFVDFNVENDKVVFNGVQYNIDVNIFPTDYPIILFGLNNAGTMSLSSVRIGRFQIYESDELIHDYVPCYRNSDSVVGMYDLVEEDFLTNDGTGTFSYLPLYS